MKKLLLIISACMPLAMIAQNKVINDPNAQVRQVKDFHGVRVSNGIQLFLTQGNEEAVAVSASDAEYRDHIKTEVEDGILKIYYDNQGWNGWRDWDKRKLKAYVSCKTLDQLRGNSGARVEVDGAIQADRLDMEFSSGSSFDGSVHVVKLHVEQNSGAEVNISGTASDCSIGASSGSSFKGYDLETDLCEANASSGASLRVTVNKELNALASSGGQIHYKGNGVIREISTGSGGGVSKR